MVWDLAFLTSIAKAGRYLATLFSKNNTKALSSAQFWVAGATEVSVVQDTLAPGDPIVVELNFAPGMMLDYVAVFPCSFLDNPDSPLV